MESRTVLFLSVGQTEDSGHGRHCDGKDGIDFPSQDLFDSFVGEF